MHASTDGRWLATLSWIVAAGALMVCSTAASAGERVYTLDTTLTVTSFTKTTENRAKAELTIETVSPKGRKVVGTRSLSIDYEINVDDRTLLVLDPAKKVTFELTYQDTEETISVEVSASEETKLAIDDQGQGRVELKLQYRPAVKGAGAEEKF